MDDDIMREIMVPRPSTTVPSTPQAFNLRRSDPGPSNTASVLTSMTNRPLASGSNPRVPIAQSVKSKPLPPRSSKSSKSLSNRQEASPSKTSSVRYHQHANGIQKKPINKPGCAPPRSPPILLTFLQKLLDWKNRYYGKVVDADNDTKEHVIRILKMEHFTAVKECLADCDYELIMYGWKLKKEAQYDKKLAFYKALRHLYYFFKGQEFKSKIDRDGDWIMGYLLATYIP